MAIKNGTLKSSTRLEYVDIREQFYAFLAVCYRLVVFSLRAFTQFTRMAHAKDASENTIEQIRTGLQCRSMQFHNH